MINQNKIVYVSSLNGDFRIRSFGSVKELICLASDIQIRSAKCMNCIQQSSPYKRYTMVEAPFSGKIKGNSNDIKEVGGADKYVALCLKCHKELKSKTQSEMSS